jgi:hypothetical protein
VQPIRESEVDGRRWFVGPGGVDVDRAACGHGHGARLAVIDYDAGRTNGLGLDRLVPVLRPPPDPGALSCHGASLVAWATRSVEPPFAGVAPLASARLYCVPRPGEELVSFPLALVRAVSDGADVVACATYLDGTVSPMLDDALELASRFGRGGRGTAVVLAASREMESVEGSVRPSLSLGLGDPASDPRVVCVGASGRDGGWFLWRDRRGRLRPFSNRGPAVRFMAPGDDVADPFAPGRLKHAESSGATAFAAGTLLLVLGTSPDLSLSELDAFLALGAARPDPAVDLQAGVASASELMPFGRDRDGHNAKHGYGRLSAELACLAARDPLCLALVRMGEVDAARAYGRRRLRDRRLAAAYSEELGRRAARALLSDHRALHALAVVLRHARLGSAQPSCPRAGEDGAAARQLGLALREIERASGRSAGAFGRSMQIATVLATIGAIWERPRRTTPSTAAVASQA